MSTLRTRITHAVAAAAVLGAVAVGLAAPGGEAADEARQARPGHPSSASIRLRSGV
jgi:hypothetical protein